MWSDGRHRLFRDYAIRHEINENMLTQIDTITDTSFNFIARKNLPIIKSKKHNILEKMIFYNIYLEFN